MKQTVVHGPKLEIVAGDGDNSHPRTEWENITRNNTITETVKGAAGWTWAAVKGTRQEGAGIFLNGTGAITVENNTVRSGFDGIDVHYSDDAALAGNTIDGCSDDGLELDIVNGMNVRAWGNTVSNCYVGVSASPVEA